MQPEPVPAPLRIATSYLLLSVLLSLHHLVVCLRNNGTASVQGQSRITGLSFDVNRGMLRHDARTRRKVIDDTMGFMHLDSLAFQRSGARQEVRLHSVSQAEEDFIRSFLRGKLGGYRHFFERAILPVPAFDIVRTTITTAWQQPAPVCATFLNVTAFFISPWHIDNLFHLHTNNILSLIQGIQASPHCDAATLKCSPPSRLFLFPSDAVRTSRGVSASVMLSKIMDAGVDTVGSLFAAGGTNRNKASAGATCVAAAVWGRGRELFYYQVPNQHSLTERADEPLPLADLRRTTDALVRRAKAAYPSNRSLSSSRPQHEGASLLTLTRDSCLDGRALSPTALPLIARLAPQHGMSTSTLRDAEFRERSFASLLHTLQQTDVLLGTHGSGLTNILYLPRGKVLIELYPYGKRQWNRPFRNMAWSRGALYLTVLVRGVKPTDSPAPAAAKRKSAGNVVGGVGGAGSGGGPASLVIPAAVLNCSLHLASLYLSGDRDIRPERCSPWEGSGHQGTNGGGGDAYAYASKSSITAHVPDALMQAPEGSPGPPRGVSDLATLPLEQVDYRALLPEMGLGLGLGQGQGKGQGRSRGGKPMVGRGG